MANYKIDPYTGTIIVEIYSGVFSSINPTTGLAWTEEEANDFVATDWVTQENNAITNLTPSKSITLQRLLKEVGEPNGFVRRRTDTVGILEFTDNGTKIYCFDQFGNFSSRNDGKFATGTSYEVDASANQIAIYPVPYPQHEDYRESATFTVWVDGEFFDKDDIEIASFDSGIGGNCYAYFDSNGSLQTAYNFIPTDHFRLVNVAIIYGNSGSGSKVSFADERHGFTGYSHSYLHLTVGLKIYKKTSFVLNGLVNQGLSYDNFSAGIAFDIDMLGDISSVTNTAFWYIDGAVPAQNWKVTNASNVFGYIEQGNTFASYNQLVGSNYQLTEMANTDYALIFFVLTKDGENPIVKIIGRNLYASVNDATDAIVAEKDNLDIIGLPTSKHAYLYAVVINGEGKLQQLSNGDNAVDLRGV